MIPLCGADAFLRSDTGQGSKLSKWQNDVLQRAQGHYAPMSASTASAGISPASLPPSSLLTYWLSLDGIKVLPRKPSVKLRRIIWAILNRSRQRPRA